MTARKHVKITRQWKSTLIDVVFSFDWSCNFSLTLLSVVEGTVNTLIATFNKTLMVYQDVALTWAAQLPHIPVAVKVASFQ